VNAEEFVEALVILLFSEPTSLAFALSADLLSS
jgi:hypothetical protein